MLSGLGAALIDILFTVAVVASIGFIVGYMPIIGLFGVALTVLAASIFFVLVEELLLGWIFGLFERAWRRWRLAAEEAGTRLRQASPSFQLAWGDAS